MKLCVFHLEIRFSLVGVVQSAYSFCCGNEPDAGVEGRGGVEGRLSWYYLSNANQMSQLVPPVLISIPRLCPRCLSALLSVHSILISIVVGF